MAGERKGRACEAIVHVALEGLITSNSLHGSLEWNNPISGLSVEPDLWIRDDKGLPSLLLLVTHSGAPSASEKKFWRNVGEIAEAKTLLGKPPTVGSVLFDTSVKRSLRLLEPLVGDFYIEVPKLQNGCDLIALAEVLANTSRTTEELLRLIRDKNRRSKKIALGLAAIATALTDRITHHACSPQETIWVASRLRLSRRKAVRLPHSRNTSVRRGLAKLLIPEDANVVIDSIGKVLLDAPAYLATLGITKPSIRGPIVQDTEIVQTVELLGKDAVKDIVSSIRTDPAYEPLVKPLRVMGATAAPMSSYVYDNWNQLLSLEGLYRHLIVTHSKGPEVLGLADDIYVRPGWLFLLLSSMVKAKSGKRQAFGYAKLINKIGNLSQVERSNIRDAAKSLGLNGLHELRSPRTIEYGLRDWFFGADRTNFNLKDVELLASAHVVVEHMRSIDKSTVPKIAATAQTMESQDLFENILIPFNKFQPLKHLLKQELIRRGLEHKDITYFPSPIFQKLSASGHNINSRATSTSLLMAKNTLIRWISVSDKGKDHKRKEFGGRAAMLPIEWSTESSQYKVRRNVKRLLLLVDGTFTDDDLSLLTKLGWDGIYYPDEVVQLCADVM